MEYFLLYIILSTVITLVSIIFAYKPNEDDGMNKRASSEEIQGHQKDRNPVYTKEPKKDLKGKRAKGMGSSLLSY